MISQPETFLMGSRSRFTDTDCANASVYSPSVLEMAKQVEA